MWSRRASQRGWKGHRARLLSPFGRRRLIPGSQLAQQVVLQVPQIGERFDTGGMEPAPAHLELDTPDVLALLPQFEKPELLALLLDLRDLVVDACDDVATPTGEGLDCRVLQVDGIFLAAAHEVIGSEVHHRKVVRQSKHRGTARVGWMFTLAAAAYNLVRLPKLLATAA
jgi:hypothetical protein